MYLAFPKGHVPRYENFQLSGLLDETMREGAERCPFSVPEERKIDLTRKIARTGVRNIVFGSAPSDPDLMARTLETLLAEGCSPDVELAFILLLNCWEPPYERFRHFPDALKQNVCISFGMVDYRSDERLFEQVHGVFHDLGFRKFRVSLINNFKSGVDERTYAHIRSQIDRSRALGIDTVRINDSLGVCYPETMAVLAANLVHDYPTTSFCVHAHDDKGLGLQNALTSIYHGFSLIEGGFSGFGNRSGLPPIELLLEIFAEKNIGIAGIGISPREAAETGYAAEDTFLVVPNVYRAVTGRIVNWENLGVANIPDYLGSDRRARKFLTDVGTHDATLGDILSKAGVKVGPGDNIIEAYRATLHRDFAETYRAKRIAYEAVVSQIEGLYGEGVLFEDDAVARARTFAA